MSGQVVIVHYFEADLSCAFQDILIIHNTSFHYVLPHYNNTSHLQVVFLENPTMLEDYVELACLPDEFGGFDSFNVNEWVEYTTVCYYYLFVIYPKLPFLSL